MSSIAKSYGLKSHVNISKQLADDPEYQQARISFHTSRLDDVEEEIRAAEDMGTLARVKELATMYRWRAERECRDIWGKAETNQSVSVNLNLSNMFQSKVSDLLSNSNVVHDVTRRTDVMSNEELVLTTEGEGTLPLSGDDAPV